MSLEVAKTSAPAARSFTVWRPWAAAITVAILFFLAARLSLSLVDKIDGIAVFWPAAGIATGFLVAFGPTMRWPVVIGAASATIAANLLGDRNLASTALFVVANAGGPVIVAGLIQRFYGTPFELNELRHVFGLFGATIATSFLTGIVGTLGFVFFHPSASSATTIWRHWFVTETLGTITVAPMIIGFASLLRKPAPRRDIVEGAFALAIVATLCLLLVVLPKDPWTLELAVAAFCPLYVWIAARLQPAFTAVATFMCAITIVCTTVFAIGVFGDARLPLGERILSAQATILATSFGALVLAALFSERRMHELAILERERRLEEALRAGRVMTFDWEVRTGMIQLSQNATEILGLGSEPSLSAANMMRQIHPDDRAMVAARLNAAGLSERSHSMTFRFLRPDGHGEVWLERVAVTHFDVAGKPIRINGLTTDVTERKRFEEEISRAWKSAAMANQAKSSFLSAASHDLRQPLQTLRFLHDALEPHLSNGEGRHIVDGMSRSLDTMSSILSSLLDVNRLEAGNLRPSKSDFAINEVFDSLASDFLGSVTEKRLRWRLVRSELRVHTDKTMLEAMLRNLLSNAVRYTDRGTVLLGCRRAGDRIRIEVWDSGIGMSQDQMPQIFQEYYQGEQGAQRGGLGLGLAIVRRIGEVLDHRIDVRSTPGKGTVFSIEVPRGDPNDADAERAEPPAPETNGFPDLILVVEDEESVRTSLSRLLKLKGIKAIMVATATDALDQVTRHVIRPDLLICDYNLRGSANGVDTVNALRGALGTNVPAIVMTGDIRSDIVQSIAAFGISVLIKPFRADELLQHIAERYRDSARGLPTNPAGDQVGMES
ncbi:ATP-binding protein [Bradyrhizobium sp. JYMT SZCCT0428]|uniref:ATP-binding protein n=1 Tax=Bradyrhizobium sp. JYMT SZCCT0428 TaxID=2807673 RepID=UPI001BA558C5|nr:ATP-binding protein [Bradyrhizobium sp. JYMT SZCCT0428]MBR1154341.1 MASE1 domain-containing protein [Bradyrhizobium sp. JYMT SZCCT0428]